MSKLGELIGYIGEACPNCGRVRVEKWSCGKCICEKCHWCIEDGAYYYEELEEDSYSTFGEVYPLAIKAGEANKNKED